MNIWDWLNQEEEKGFDFKKHPQFYNWLISKQKYTKSEIASLSASKIATLQRSFRKWKEKNVVKGTPEYKETAKLRKVKPFPGSDFEVDFPQITREETEPFGREHLKGQIFLNGKWQNEKDVVRWLNNNVANWSKDQIKQLQAELGFKKLTGDYTSSVKKRHLAYLKERSKPEVGLEAGKKQLERNVQAYNEGLDDKRSYLSFDRGQYYPPGTDLNKQYSEADKRVLEVQAFQNQQYEKQQEEALSRKQKIMNEVGSWYQEATGFSISDPTSPLYGKVSQKDLLGKYLGGWDYDNYFFWARNRPEIKNRYPGLNDDLTITEYNQARQLAQTIAIQKLGYPLSKTQLEIAIKTGEIPKAGMSTGSPLIGAQ